MIIANGLGQPNDRLELERFRFVDPSLRAQRDCEVRLADERVRVVSPEGFPQPLKGSALGALRVAQQPEIMQAVSPVELTRQRARVILAKRVSHRAQRPVHERERLAGRADTAQVDRDVVLGHQRERVRPSDGVLVRAQHLARHLEGRILVVARGQVAGQVQPARERVWVTRS